MPKITYVSADGDLHVVDVPIGTSVMRGAVGTGIDGIVAECGGNAMCATCHVYVPAEHAASLPEMTAVEDEMLECTVAERRATSRLSCQLRITEGLDGLVVRLPEAQE
ncbi:2Fe-2S iron-sulfur cluster-binding protein [Phytoactinopolyspora halotolerans]|uniref:2Fe-2S iron-sulfur cluster binding domain-containing protein n=1 Tax=Phytoactinopolyspora halotolerans TaxID=1981512 RepID=A0A6L9S719_9ACTN|nr:2Fe-2S iron-sulfur cluster-binding protein [Phytoactinopolyspora halotolerans]NEE01265.1 2Fe-2S iron-sulfur cluster binding domain-containing protein [Phytoactinopolyspora halotolerans]